MLPSNKCPMSNRPPSPKNHQMTSWTMSSSKLFLLLNCQMGIDRLVTALCRCDCKVFEVKSDSYASELRFSDSLLQERPTLWSGIGGATSSTLRIGPYWMNPSSKPFPWRYTDSNIKEANDANVVDLDDNDQINIELWTSLGFAIVQITEVRNSQFLFSILLREQTMSLALLFHWGCYLSEINASL